MNQTCNNTKTQNILVKMDKSLEKQRIFNENPTMWITIQTRYEQTKDIGMLEINHRTIIKHQTSMISTNNHNLIKIGFGTKTKPWD